MEARPLADVPVIGFERGGNLCIGDQLVDPLPMLLHNGEVKLLSGPDELLDARTFRSRWVLDRSVVTCPAVIGEVGVDPSAQHDGLEVVHPCLLPAWLQTLRERRIGGAVPPDPDRRGGALEDVDVPGCLGERRKSLQSARPGADQGHGLVAEVGERLA